MRPWMTAAVAALALCATGIPAAAATITRTVEFSAWDFTAYGGGGGGAFPTAPIAGSVTVSFDPTVSIYNSTAGITLNYLNLTLGSPIAFSYYHDQDRLNIGGAHGGVNGISGNSNDFWAEFARVTTGNSKFLSFAYNQDAPGIYYTQTGKVQISAVPEPTTWAMMIAGFGMAGALLRRSRTRPLFAAA